MKQDLHTDKNFLSLPPPSPTPPHGEMGNKIKGLGNGGKNLKLEMKNQARYTDNKWSLGVSRGSNVGGQGHYGAGRKLH